jgi:hypothetical protein
MEAQAISRNMSLVRGEAHPNRYSEEKAFV